MTKEGTTIGIWVPEEDESLIEEFDTYFHVGPNRRSRSKEIKDAMRTHMAFHRALEANGVDADINPRELELYLRETLRKALEHDERG